MMFTNQPKYTLSKLKNEKATNGIGSKVTINESLMKIKIIDFDQNNSS